MTIHPIASKNPRGWVATTVGDIADTSSGYGFPEKFQGKKSGKLPFAKVRDISFAFKNANGRLSEADNFVDEATLKTLKARSVPAGSTVFAKIGEALRLNRRVILDVDAVLDNNCMAVTPDIRVVDAEFVYRFLTTVDLSPFAVATTVPSVRRGDVTGIPLNLPPLSEQRRIVARIESLSSKSKRARSHLDHIPRLVEKYKLAILAAGYDGKLTRNFASPPPTLSISTMIASLDQGWSPKCESEPASDHNDWAVMKTTAIQPIHFNGAENKKLPVSLKPRPQIVIEPDDVLITRAGPRSRVAIACVVKTTRPRLMLCDKAYRLRVNPSIANATFLALMLNAPRSLDILEQMKTGMSDSGLNLTQGKFLELPIPSYSLAEQQEVIRSVEAAFAWIDRLVSETTNARKLIGHLDQAILAKAFRGELVPQDPNDEPVRVLLDKAKATLATGTGGNKKASNRSATA